jgi:signal transduction histidine kinase/CheY-like chemotaxis protein
MSSLITALQIVSAVVFAGVAIVSILRARRGSRPAREMALAFSSLAAILLIGLVLPDEGGPVWITKLVLVVLLAFPYLLFRFTSSYDEGRRFSNTLALVAFGVMAVISLALPDLSGAGEERPAWLSLYLVALLAYWTVLSVVVVVRLWRAGRGHPTLTRRRMWLMSAAVAILNVALLVGGTQTESNDVVEVIVQGLVLLTGIAFFVGFAPPPTLRIAWRAREQRAARDAMDDLLRAESERHVASALLPHVAALVGASDAAMLGPDGEVVAAQGATPTMVHDLVSGNGHRNGTGTPLRIPIRGDHGELVVWPTRYTPIFGDEDVLGVHDLAAAAGLALESVERFERERAAAAEADRANLAKSEFLSAMSHELRTPLNSVLGFGQLLEMAELSERDADSVHHILRAGRLLLQLVDEVLDLSRIESGRLALSPEAVELRELVGNAVELIRPLAADRQIAVSVEDVSCDVHVQADRQRLKQVLLNLLSNAVKYNHDGGRIDVRCDRASDGHIRIGVRDTGPGIAPERQGDLFEPFERLGAERSGIEGTGLGLALAAQLTEAMGGTIDVETVVGEGSTFWVELPLTESPISALERESLEDEAPPPDASAERAVLLIEDNLSNLTLVERIMESRPHVTLLSAMQGGLGVELARRHRPDLILLDLHLPDVPGDEVLLRLQADPETREIPVVIVSADATEGRVRRVLDAGAADYLSKPIDVRKLLELVDRHLMPVG